MMSGPERSATFTETIVVCAAKLSVPQSGSTSQVRPDVPAPLRPLSSPMT
jgi:hypothetical protein